MSARKTILIVDDDTAFLASNRDLFEAYGYEVFTASDGKAGYDAACRVRPDVMILDVMMATNTEGFDVARRVRETPELKNTAVVLVTGVVDAMGLPHPLQPDMEWLPVERVLEKPVEPVHMIAEVERVLEERKKED